MKIKTSELGGVALNYAVAIACDYKCALDTPENGPDEWIVMGREEMWLERDPDYFDVWAPSTDWLQAGPLIDRFKVGVIPLSVGLQNDQPPVWYANAFYDGNSAETCCKGYGSTALESACRAIVGLKLGEEVDVPEGLV